MSGQIKTDGQQFLEELAQFPRETFDHRFANTSAGLGLGELFNRNELKLLYEASLRALMCNLAINGIGAPNGQVRPEDETERRQLEQEFMQARELFYASPGWQNLGPCAKAPIDDHLLSVFVLDDRLDR
jgi:hypothetical protein